MGGGHMFRKLTADEAEPHKIRFVAQLEEVLQKWKHSNQQHFKSPTWNKSDAKLQFGGCEFIMTRYWISEISEERDVSDTDDQGDTKETFEIPKAWLESRNKSEMFPWDKHFYIRSYYGLEDFIVIYYSNEAYWYTTVDKFLDILLSAVNKTGCRTPLFALFQDNDDIMEYTFEITSHRNAEDLETSKDLLDAKVSVWSNYRFNEPTNQLLNVDSTTDFKIEECSDDPKQTRNRFELCAYWSDLLDSEAIDDKCVKKLDLLKAHKWSVQIRLADAAEVLLGDCLKKFLELYSTQTESLFKHPQIASLLKYRRIYKQRKEVDAVQGLKPEVRKVASKLTLKSEESLIPVESLDAFFNFLFCDEELKIPQNSNGGNPSTTTTDEEEVEDKSFSSYKELRYFESAQPSITCRLAICLCIVNKYYGGIRAVDQLWAEFVLEMKYRLENNCEINNLEPVEPNVDYAELLNKLQVLNDCIKKRKARDASSAITSTTCKSITESSGEEFIDISELPADEESVDQLESSVSASMMALMRVQKLFDHSLPMNTFKRANPGCAIGDLVRWCLTEDWTEEMVKEGRDKATNEVYLNKRIKVSESLSMVFHNDQIPRRFPDDDDAEKVLHWLASVKPSDLVFGLMPVLIHSVVIALLKHPASKLHQNVFQHQLIKIKERVPQCNSQNWLENIKDVIHNLKLVADKMTKVQYLLKKFRYFDPTISVSDQELEGFVFELVEFSSASILTLNEVLPSSTNLGKIIYKFFTGHEVVGHLLEVGSHNVCKLKYSGIPYHTCYPIDVLTSSFNEFEFRIGDSNTCAVSNKETAS